MCAAHAQMRCTVRHATGMHIIFTVINLRHIRTAYALQRSVRNRYNHRFNYRDKFAQYLRSARTNKLQRCAHNRNAHHFNYCDKFAQYPRSARANALQHCARNRNTYPVTNMHNICMICHILYDCYSCNVRCAAARLSALHTFLRGFVTLFIMVILIVRAALMCACTLRTAFCADL